MARRRTGALSVIAERTERRHRRLAAPRVVVVHRDVRELSDGLGVQVLAERERGRVDHQRIGVDEQCRDRFEDAIIADFDVGHLSQRLSTHRDVGVA
jgi:hypothetical protein